MGSQEKEMAVEQHQKDVQAAATLAEENVALFEKRIAALAEKIAKHDAELQLLADGGHNVQEENRKAQSVLEATIAEYEQQITSLTGQIFANEKKVEEMVK